MHTPGPWQAVDQHPSHPGIEIEIKGHPDYPHGGAYHVAQVNCVLTTPDVTVANAHLIAAAPELLAALEFALEFLTANDDGEDDVGNRIASAKAAIGKVKGTA